MVTFYTYRAINSHFCMAGSGIFEEFSCFYLKYGDYLLMVSAYRVKISVHRLIYSAYHAKISAYHLIYSAYHEAVSAYRPLCIF